MTLHVDDMGKLPYDGESVEGYSYNLRDDRWYVPSPGCDLPEEPMPRDFNPKAIVAG